MHNRSHCLLPGSDITLLSPSRGLLFILFIHIYPFYPNLSYLLEINNSLHIRPVDCCLLCCYRSAVQQQLFLIFRQTKVSGPPPLCQLQKHFFTINKQKSKWMTSESPNFHWRGTGGNSLSGMSSSERRLCNSFDPLKGYFDISYIQIRSNTDKSLRKQD